MEKALYLKDCYLKEFDAAVVSVKDNKYVILDKTGFYPLGGGQPHDTGKIIFNSEEYNVIFVGKFGNEISHEVSKPGLQEGNNVHCIINWERRYKLMRMHTAMHILCSVLHKENGCLITGNQLGEDKSRVDFGLENFDREKINFFIEKANEEIRKNKEVKISFTSKEEAEKLSKLASEDNYQNMNELRIISIVDIDTQPCGGCHVKNTSEIKEIKLDSLENKGKGRKRVYFTLLD